MMRGSSYTSLDLLRAAAALAVLFAHSRGFAWVEYGALPASQHILPVQAFFLLTRGAYEAVLVFFVLSGALVGGQIIRRTIEGRFSMTDYAIDRVTRIFLPLLPAVVVGAAVQAIVLSDPPSAFTFLANLTGLNGVFAPTIEADVPLWSLAYEIWFYVLGGALAVVLTQASLPALAVAFAAVGVFSVLPAALLMFWVLGALTVLVTLPLRTSAALAICGSLVATIGCAAYELGSATRSFTQLAILPGRLSEFLICAGVAATFPFLRSDAVQKRLAFIKKPASAVAGMSYTLYLMHYPVLYVLTLVLPKADAIDLRSLVLYALRIVACFAVSWLFYRAFESNTAKARAWLRAAVQQSSG